MGVTLDDVKPFLKFTGLVLGIAVVGLLARCASNSRSAPAEACNALPMDQINPCLKEAERCPRADGERKACVDDVVRRMKK